MRIRRSSRQRPRADKAAPQIATPTAEAAADPARSLELLRSPAASPAQRGRAALGLQRVVGNARVDGLLQSVRVATIARQPDPAPPAADPALDQFKKQTFSRENYHPDTHAGLFDVSYLPQQGEMTVTVKVAFQFLPGDPTTLPAAEQANFAGVPASDFQWKPDERSAWAENAIRDVQTAWERQYTFHNTHPGWESLPPVNVNIAVLQTPADKAHFVTTVHKWPQSASPRDRVNYPPAGKNQDTAQFEERSDDGSITQPDRNSFTARPDEYPAYNKIRDANPKQIFFPIGKSEIKSDERGKVESFAKELAKPGIPPFPVKVVGHASTDGGAIRNQTLSEDRAREVSNVIVTGGAKKQPEAVGAGTHGSGPGPKSRRADIAVEPYHDMQETVVHEFGHMFGLQDEYPEAGVRNPGDTTGHSAQVAKLMPDQEPIVAADNDSIMSMGSTIKPHHYVTFLEALGKISGTEGQWKVGPGPGPKHGPGDFPTPKPDGPQAA